MTDPDFVHGIGNTPALKSIMIIIINNTIIEIAKGEGRER